MQWNWPKKHYTGRLTESVGLDCCLFDIRRIAIRAGWGHARDKNRFAGRDIRTGAAVCGSRRFRSRYGDKSAAARRRHRRGVWTWWVEGGEYRRRSLRLRIQHSGVRYYAETVGMAGRHGVDYSFASSPWHLSADFRYMENGSNSAGGPETAIFSPAPAVPVPAPSWVPILRRGKNITGKRILWSAATWKSAVRRN